MDLLSWGRPVVFVAAQIALVVALAGCGSPMAADCQFSCASSGQCPDGLRCVSSMCRTPDAVDTCPAAGVDAAAGDGADPDGGSGRACVAAPPGCEQGTCGCVQRVAAGARHTCAIVTTEAGPKVACWGDNQLRQLDGAIADPAPGGTAAVSVAVDGATGIAGGGYHTCLRTDTGYAVCWGSNSRGQVGWTFSHDGPWIEWSEGSVETAAGFEHSCALIAGRGVSCWGANGSKQLGLGPAGTNVFATADAIAVAAGGDRTCVVTNARGVACWGDNQLGLLGTGGGATLDTPAPVPELTDVAGLCMGSLHTCARTTAGTVHCWGANARGQVAILDLEAVTAPTRVPGLPADVVELACGGDHSCARTGSGDVWCWGENDDGEVDASGDVAVRAPRRLEAVCGATAIAAGYHHTCAATPVGLVCWGLNQYGELGGPSTQHLTIAGICDPSTPRLIESAPTDDAHRSRAAAR